MADLVFLPTLERLHPHDKTNVTPNLKAFGLTFSVALGNGHTPNTLAVADSFLAPWTWGEGASLFRPIEKVYLHSLDGSVKKGPFPVIRGTGHPSPSFRTVLSRRFGEFKSGNNAWGWGGAQDSTKISRESRSWPAFLGQVSLYPYPLPQAIGLSSRLEVPETEMPPMEAVVAPVFKVRHQGWDFELEPDLQTPNGKQVTLTYKFGPPVQVPPPPGTPPSADPPPPAPAAPTFLLQVETLACDLADPGQKGYFNFSDLWVQINKEDVANSEWRTGLEARLAEQLHVARILVDWLVGEIQKKPRPPLSDYPVIASIVLEQLVATFGPGVRKGPEGPFLDRARFFGKTPFPQSSADTLREKATTWLGSEKERTRLGWIREAVTGIPLEKSGAGLLDLAVRGADRTERVRDLASLSLEQTVAELEQILASLSNPATLRELFRIQWKAFLAFKDPQPSAAASEFARALLDGPPPEIDLQRLLLLDHLGDYWPEFAADLTKLAETYQEKILKPLAVPGWTEDFQKALARKVVASVRPKADEDIRALDPGRTKGLTFQLDTLGKDPRSADHLIHLQGLGLLMQKKGDTHWKCLNMAAAHVEDEELSTVLLPTRLAYLNDVRSPTVTYDNGPLTAEGPMSPCAVSGVRLAASSAADPCEDRPSGIDEPLVDFRFEKDAKIPGLVFGTTYRVVPFMVTNSGAIPKSLSDGNPWKLMETIPNQAVEGTPREVTYLREMHVGSLRVKPKGAAALPPIPEKVAPRIRELSPKAVLPEKDPLFGDPKRLADPNRPADELAQTDALLANTPLLLLAKGFPARSGMKVAESFRFEVRPPTVDLETWDRWVAKDADKNRRKFIWRSFYQLAYDKGETKGNLEDVGVYLDDPAVEGIYVEVKELGVANPTSWQSLNLKFSKKKLRTGANSIAADFHNWKEADCTLETEQYEAIPIACEMKDEGLLVTAGTETKIFPTSPTTMYRLSVYVSLLPDAEKRFWQTATRKEIVRDDGKIKGTSPWHLLIEIPRALPQTKALGTALWSSLKPSYDKGVLKVDLDMNDVADLKGHVYRAEILHQVWSWRGRPPADHPQLKPGAPLRAFHMSEFGARGDDEHRRLPMPRSVRNAAEPFFHYEEDLSRQGPEGDLRALHHRFSARVFSRWEGILPEGQGVLEAENDKTRDRWQPQFVPCRRPAKVPAPKIRMVLPLTHGVSEKVEGGPGLMVVVDGPWYEVGGLAEQLGIEVVPVSDPEFALGQQAPKDKTYYQIGTDPIVTNKSAGEAFDPNLRTLNLKQFKVEFSQVDGAIGHHRDHSQTDPRFLASSFLLSRPTISRDGQAKPVDLSWWFLKLRFYRKLTAEGQADALESERSAPFWVQLLPGVERVEEDWLGEGAHEVKLKGQVLEVTGIQKVAPREGFHLFAVMTRKVADFAGRPDQEAYLGVWAWNPQTLKWTKEFDVGTEKDLYVRFIEVQSKKAPSPGALWGRIFDANQSDIDRARIVRISNRYDVNGGQR
ncbi:MAG TPA: hypothetical protein VF789_16495 [Thermoanaerobaculia bacterium]